MESWYLGSLSPKGFTLTLLETLSIHNSMNISKMNSFFIFKRKSGTASLNKDSQWSKQEACFARVTRVWLAVNHNTSVTSGE